MVDKEKSAGSSRVGKDGRKYIFGPVNSRRLGLSLGVDLLPEKICSYDCLYCEVGLTKILTCERKEYVPTKEVIEEVGDYLQGLSGKQDWAAPDVITVTGSGEPTLHSGIGRIIGFIKNTCDIPVVVLTNGSLLFDPAVRLDLLAADVVVPSLDSALAGSFRKINRPVAGCADISRMIEALAIFTEEFGGEVWLEILVAEGINDSDADINALVDGIGIIRPAKVQLNTIVRPPAESWVKPVSAVRLAEIAGRIQTSPVEIIADYSGSAAVAKSDARGPDIERMLKRRPCTMTDICEALGLGADEAEKLIDKLIGTGRIREKIYDERKYYQPENG